MEAASGDGSWEHQRSFQRDPHTRAVQANGRKPDIIGYFLVSTPIGPLIQKCEIVKSVPWGPHHGVKLVLNINFESVVSRQLIGKISKRSRHNTKALQGQNAHHTEEADQHFGTKQDARVFSKSRSLALKTDRKTPKQHAPNMQARVVSWRRQMSWATLWRLGVMPRLNIG